MPSLRERMLDLVHTTPGLTDREITDRLLGPGSRQQGVNTVARALASSGHVLRKPRADGKIGNFPSTDPVIPRERGVTSDVRHESRLSEDDLKRSLQKWLELDGWNVRVVWDRGQGVDIEARRGESRWVIEVKGQGSLDAMRVNYFLAVLGEVLQRMDDPSARYSVAFQEIPQFRRLWSRLPSLAKERTGISALFVSGSGEVDAVS